MDEPAEEAASDVRQIACTMSSGLLRLVRAQAGADAIDALLARSGCARSERYLDNPENWISLEDAMALLEAGVAVTGDPLLPRRVGEEAVRQHAGSPVATLLRSLGSPEAVMRSITAAAGKFSTVSELMAIEAAPGRAVVQAVARAGFARHPMHCMWTAGLLSAPPVLFALPPATVTETECQARGGERCLYTIAWDA